MPTALDQLTRGRLMTAFALLFFCAAVTAVRAEAFTALGKTTREKAAGDRKAGSADSGSRSAAAPEDKNGAAGSEAAVNSESIDRIRALEEAVKSQNARLEEMRN